MMKLLSDEELFSRYKATGNNDCFTTIYNRRVERVRHYLMRLMPASAGAIHHSYIDDLIQRVFTDLIGHVGFKKSTLLNYLLERAKWHCLDLRRHLTAKKRATAMPEVEISETDSITTVTPFDDLCAKETREALQDMIDRLPEVERNIINLYLGGTNKSKIAKALGISPRTFLTHYNFAVRLLKIMAHGRDLAVA